MLTVRDAPRQSESHPEIRLLHFRETAQRVFRLPARPIKTRRDHLSTRIISNKQPTISLLGGITMHGQKLHASTAFFNSLRWVWSQAAATMKACMLGDKLKVETSRIKPARCKSIVILWQCFMTSISWSLLMNDIISDSIKFGLKLGSKCVYVVYMLMMRKWLWPCVSTEHRCYKHRDHLSSFCYGPALRHHVQQLYLRSRSRERSPCRSVISHFPFCPFPLPATRH